MTNQTSPQTAAAKADVLRTLHAGPGMLVLPNAWDAASARAVAAAGFPAVATTSAGVALALGYLDGEKAPMEEMLAAAARVVAAVDVPVTIDFEAGYQLSVDEIARRLIAIGAAGLNYEDTDHYSDAKLLAAELQAERVAALKAAGRAQGVDLVVNARVDVFIHKQGTPEEQLTEGLRRALLYKEAGADCIYPILLGDEAMLAQFVRAVGPVNINLRRGGPLTLQRAAAIGIRRVSYAASIFRDTMNAHDAMVREVKAEADAL
jgi:2-methylisocitrate lyase-like PEP mutase family enzyme